MNVTYSIKGSDGKRLKMAPPAGGMAEILESIELIRHEMRAGLPKREQREAQQQIAVYVRMMEAIRIAGM